MCTEMGEEAKKRRSHFGSSHFGSSHFGSSHFLFKAILPARVGLLCCSSSFRPSRLLWMGRNRKWVLEDSLQDAVWKTILRGPRPPSVRWEKPRNQSAAVTHHPGAKRNKSSSVKSEAKKKDPPQVVPPRRVHHTGRCTGCSPPASWEIGSSSFNVGGRRRDCCSHPGCFDESPCPGTGTAIPGACRVHEEVRGEAAEEGRGGPCECRQGQGGFGRSSGLPGERRIFVGRWRREVVAAACCSATSPFTLHRSTIERFSCLSSGGQPRTTKGWVSMGVQSCRV